MLKATQIFSFVHELAHLFRKTDSILMMQNFRTVEINLTMKSFVQQNWPLNFYSLKKIWVQNYYSVSDITLSHLI